MIEHMQNIIDFMFCSTLYYSYEKATVAAFFSNIILRSFFLLRRRWMMVSTQQKSL